MKTITSIKQINMEIPEGKLLIAAIGKLATESQADKTDEEIL